MGSAETMRQRLVRNAAVLLALLLAGSAADTLRDSLPPTMPLPPRIAADTLFTDDFSHGLSRWRDDRSGVWSIRHGMLRADLPDRKQERSLIYAGSEDWVDYALDFDVCMMRGVDKGAVVRVVNQSGVGVDLRGGGYQDVVMYSRELPLGKASAVNANATWNHIRIEARGRHFRVYVNGDLRLDRRDLRRPRGCIALAAYTGGVGECTVYYDNVVVTRLH